VKSRFRHYCNSDHRSPLPGLIKTEIGMGSRPRPELRLSKFDYTIELPGAVGLACLFILPAIFYNDLPGEIPRHFSLSGQADAFANRNFIWFLPVLGLLLYTGFTVLNRYPYIFNYPVEVTSENAQRLYTLGTRTIRLLKVLITFSFAFVSYKTIAVATGEAGDPGKIFLPLFVLILVLVFFTTIFSMKKGEK
jgi:hypothetical protein